MSKNATTIPSPLVVKIDPRHLCKKVLADEQGRCCLAGYILKAAGVEHDDMLGAGEVCDITGDVLHIPQALGMLWSKEGDGYDQADWVNSLNNLNDQYDFAANTFMNNGKHCREYAAEICAKHDITLEFVESGL